VQINLFCLESVAPKGARVRAAAVSNSPTESTENWGLGFEDSLAELRVIDLFSPLENAVLLNGLLYHLSCFTLVVGWCCLWSTRTHWSRRVDRALHGRYKEYHMCLL